MSKYFGTDGFRGEAGITLTADHAYKVGRFLGWYYNGLRERNGDTDPARIVIGKDTRRSSYMFEYSLVAGLTASGADAYLLHVTTTPSVAYIARVDDFDCGIMISASHNPYYDNGIKLIDCYGEKMPEETLLLVEDYIDGKLHVFDKDWPELPFAHREHIGCTVDYVAGRNRYMGYLISLGIYSFKGVKVGLDCANGSSWNIAKSVFDALGADTYVINNNPNGLNINNNAGSTHIEGLQKFVVEKGLGVGFAYDGDADRCLCVDEKGNVITGDHMFPTMHTKDIRCLHFITVHTTTTNRREMSIRQFHMQDIEKRNVNCIIVKDLSRFGRNYIETGRYLERIFPFMGVRFIAINDHYDSAEENDDKGRILIPFNNLINDTYCRDISLRVRSHLDVKRKEGQFIGSFAGYGYRKDPKDKNHLIIDEYAAGIVQEIFKSKLNGMSSQRIASHLNELGVLPPNEYKRANGFNYTCGFQAGLNQKWTVVSVNRILKNESYTGTLIQGKRRKINYKVKKSHDVGSENWIRVEDAHDAIISKGEFQQVQQLLELDTRTAPSQTTVYPLSGFLRCADCGQNMIRRTVTKNGKKYQYYHCSTYKNGGGCTPHMINSEKLTESVLTAIRHQVSLLVEAEKVLSNAELASGEQIGIKILDSQITALEAELERYSNLKIRLYQDLCDDVVSREEYGEMNTRFAQKIKEAQDKIQEIREKKQEALKHDTLLPTWLEEFKQYEHIKTLERRVVVELIDHIDVHSKTEIEIHFCFEDELHSITEKFMEYQAHHGNEVAEE